MSKHANNSTKLIDHSLLSALKAFPFLEVAILFGSVAKGTEVFDSDIDIAVLADEILTVEQRIEIIEALASVTGRAVDLVDIHTAGIPIMSDHVRNY